jgi:hypothetical protein
MKVNKKQAAMTPIADNAPIYIKVKRKVRLILWGGAAANQSENTTFEWSAKNIAGNYKDMDKQGKFIITIKKINTAKEIIKYVDEYKEDEIYSLDIFTHGGPNALYLTTASHDTRPFMRARWHNVSLYRNLTLMYENHALYMLGSARASGINFSKFTENARIELHGCATAKDGTDTENITADISKYLYKAGKKKAYAVGHAKKGSPMINGKGTKNEEQDYRHGVRIIFYNGTSIETTKKNGHLNEKYYENLTARHTGK